MTRHQCDGCAGTDVVLFIKDESVRCAECLRQEEMEDPHVTVCSECLRASCWFGEFMCDGARDAGTVYKKVSELRALARESEHYWEVDPTAQARRI